MKKLFLLAIFLLGICLQHSNAQKFGLSKAENYLQYFKFEDAVKKFEKVLKRKPDNFEAKQGLAQLYYIKGDYVTSNQWYAKVVADTANASKKDFLHYGETLRYVKDYKLAQEMFEKYAELAPDDTLGTLLSGPVEDVYKLISDSLHYRVNFLDFNDSNQEFSPAFYSENSIIFPSSRNGESKVDDRWYDIPFLDLYVSEKNDTGFTKPSRLESELNNRYHEGPLTIDTAFTKMIFTRNNYVKKKKETGVGEIMRLTMFSAKNLGSETDSSGHTNYSWGEIEELPFNSDDYSIGHPSLSIDGKTLYFSSNMPGGEGGLDIYKVEIDSNGGYGEPVNLGKAINTPGEESFPFIHQSGTLYFASDARMGLGGLDIYYSEQSDSGTWSEPINMGYPINTNNDDFGLILDAEEDGGYLSSNRGGVFTNDDIYSFDKRGLLLTGTVLDTNTGNPIAGATVFVREANSDKVDTFETEADGKYLFEIFPNNEYTLSSEKHMWFLVSEEVVNTDEAKVPGIIKQDLFMTKLQVGAVIKLENIYYDYDKYNIRSDAAEELDRISKYLIKYPDLVVELGSHTDCRASDKYNNTLSRRRAESATEYLISKGAKREQLTAKGYGETELVNECADGVECTEEQHQENRRTEFKVIEQPEEIKVKGSVE